jgi:hypothetical protein
VPIATVIIRTIRIPVTTVADTLITGAAGIMEIMAIMAAITTIVNMIAAMGIETIVIVTAITGNAENASVTFRGKVGLDPNTGILKERHLAMEASIVQTSHGRRGIKTATTITEMCAVTLAVATVGTAASTIVIISATIAGIAAIDRRAVAVSSLPSFPFSTPVG